MAFAAPTATSMTAAAAMATPAKSSAPVAPTPAAPQINPGLPALMAHRTATESSYTRRRLVLAQCAVDPTAKLMGEGFGARDPFAAELESDFTDKVLGNADTEHRIFIGKLSHIFKNRMADMELTAEYSTVVSDAELDELTKKISVGLSWMVERVDGKARLTREWACSSEEAAVELKGIVEKLVADQMAGLECNESWVQVSLDGPKVQAELSQESTGSLLFNHFIIAAKIEDIPVKYLLRKQRAFWA